MKNMKNGFKQSAGSHGKFGLSLACQQGHWILWFVETDLGSCGKGGWKNFKRAALFFL